MNANVTKRAVLTKRDRLNLKMNIVISSVIFILGVSSVFVSAVSQSEENFFFEFRYMTMNGTIFTTLISLLVLMISAIEIKRGKGFESNKLYYFRLSSAVTESIIGVVIAMSFFPFVPDNPDILSYDSFNMHVVIPLLSIVSFLLNKSPVETMNPLMRLNCAWLITLYAAVVITLIVLGFIPQDKIPYSFLDFKTRPIWYMIYFGCFIYSFTYVLSFLFTDWNRKISYFWIEDSKKPISSQ